LKIYGSPLSPRYRRLSIAAAELGVPVQRVELNVAKGENRSAEYLAKNPMGKVPTFEDDDGWTLWESCAVLAHWGEKYAERKLFPAHARERADALRWMFWASAHLDPAVGLLYTQKFLGPMQGRTPDENVVKAATTELGRFMPVLESHLAQRPWMLGEQFSLVDVALGASVDTLLRKELGFDAGLYPRTVAWRARLIARPSWTA